MKKLFIFIIEFIGVSIWNLSEYFHIGLGFLAPYVFGMCIGRLPHRIKSKKNK